MLFLTAASAAASSPPDGVDATDARLRDDATDGSPPSDAVDAADAVANEPTDDMDDTGDSTPDASPSLAAATDPSAEGAARPAANGGPGRRPRWLSRPPSPAAAAAAPPPAEEAAAAAAVPPPLSGAPHPCWSLLDDRGEAAAKKPDEPRPRLDWDDADQRLERVDDDTVGDAGAWM